MPGPFSHACIQVSDVDASVRFYRDILGFKVSLDRIETLENDQGEVMFTRRVAYLRWDEDSPSFISIARRDGPLPTNKPLKNGDNGLTHISFWVDDIDERYRHLAAHGVKLLGAIVEQDGLYYGLPRERKIRTFLFNDPDGTVLQFDQLY
jgi:catechol 2,3-dioxygenase-like lactoylglutathione lyase family enzyme